MASNSYFKSGVDEFQNNVLERTTEDMIKAIIFETRNCLKSASSVEKDYDGTVYQVEEISSTKVRWNNLLKIRQEVTRYHFIAPIYCYDKLERLRCKGEYNVDLDVIDSFENDRHKLSIILHSGGILGTVYYRYWAWVNDD